MLRRVTRVIRGFAIVRAPIDRATIMVVLDAKRHIAVRSLIIGSTIHGRVAQADVRMRLSFSLSLSLSLLSFSLLSFSLFHSLDPIDHLNRLNVY